VDGTELSALSGPNGRFELRGIPSGNQRLVLEHLSYGRHARRLTIEPAREITIEARISTQAIELAPLLVESLSDLERRRITTGSQINEVTREELDLAHRTGRTLAEIMRERIPGTSVRPGRFGGVCVEFRGGRAAGGPCRELTVFLDGIRISDPGVLYTMMPPDNVERMELLSPAQAGSRYGSISGSGVLLVETRRPPPPPERNEPRPTLGFDWTPEAHPYPWKKVFATSFLTNAIAVGLSLVLADQCMDVPEQETVGFRATCNGVATTGVVALSMGLPAFGTSLVARRSGETERSRSRITPAVLGAGLALATGYVLALNNTSGSTAASGIVLGIGVPALVTLSDRMFRTLRLP